MSDSSWGGSGPRPLAVVRPLAMLAVAIMCIGCAPTQSVRPLPEFVDEAIEPGDKVIITTRSGEVIEFVVRGVTNSMLIGDDHRVALEDIDTLQKRSWSRPPSPCGGDEQLGCSVPLLISLTSDVYAHYRRHFHDACTQHDYCYRHGFVTYGLDREACDNEFLENMRKSCPAPRGSPLGIFVDVSSVHSSHTCLSTADEFYAVVRRYGESEFHSDTSTVCEYDGPP